MTIHDRYRQIGRRAAKQIRQYDDAVATIHILDLLYYFLAALIHIVIRSNQHRLRAVLRAHNVFQHSNEFSGETAMCNQHYADHDLILNIDCSSVPAHLQHVPAILTSPAIHVAMA